MANYLVTGGCGFIGSHLCDRLLADGHRVRVLDNLSTGKRENLAAGIELVVGDITDAALVRDALRGQDGCFHLAAVASVQRSVEDWVGTHATNLSGTVAILDAARHHGGLPVVYASSAAVYGANPDTPLGESAATQPLSAYGADKLGCELHARVATRLFAVPTTGFRIFNVFGPRQDPSSPYSGVISIFSQRLARGQPITVFGDGLQSRDFVFVNDVVAHFARAMETPAAEERVFNLCTGRSTTLLQLIATLGELLNIEPSVRHEPARPGDIRISLGRPDLARKALGIEARTALKDGLAATLASFGDALSPVA